MPNHVHVTIAFRKTTKRINKIIGDGKRFIGYEIIKRLQEKDNYRLLEILKNAVKPSDEKRGKLYEVWEDSFNWKECNNSIFSWQKINYMHNNPFSGKWRLSENAIEYDHSSARFYITGEQGTYPVLNFNDLNDINLLGY